MGRMLSAAEASGHTYSFTWDALGRNLTQAGPLGTSSYAYDAAGRRTRLTYPGSGLYVDYDYLVTGEVSAIRENGATSGVGLLGTYAYDDRGRRTALTRGNGSSATYTYDDVSRPTELVEDPGGTDYDQVLGFTPNPAGQIASTTRSNDTFAWTGHYAVNRAYTTNGLNQYTASGSISPTYDGRGNLQSAASSTWYIYNSENMLTSAWNQATLSYDPLHRLFQISGATVVRQLYDGATLIAEYDNGNSLLRRYVHGPGVDEPLVWYEGTGTSDRRFYHADERGSIVATSNSSGAMLTVNSYDEYGIPGASNSGRFQYTGQQWLSDIGMYHYRARIYSPTLGRFLQTDPIGYGDGMNIYAYVGNDPVNASDPSGLGEADPPPKKCTSECWGPPLTGTRIPGWAPAGLFGYTGGSRGVVYGSMDLYKITEWSNGSVSSIWFELRGTGALAGFLLSNSMAQSTNQECARIANCTGGRMSAETAATMHSIMTNNALVHQMGVAWNMSFGHAGRGGVHEHGFWIGQNSSGYFARSIDEALMSDPGRIFASPAHGAVIYFHTHPFSNRWPGLGPTDLGWAGNRGVLSIVLSNLGYYWADYRN